MVETIRKVIVITLSAISMMADASQDCMVLSNGSELHFAHFGENTLHIGRMLLKGSTALNPVWPSYTETIGGLVFEATENGRSGIYKANSADSFNNAELIMLGKYPALSPDGDKVAYYDEHNNLAIKDIRFGTNVLISEFYEELSIWMRPLWLSNNELIYVTKNNDVFVYGLSGKSHSKLFPEKLFPVVSSNGIVLFIDYDAKTVFEYKSGELRPIINNRFLSMGPGVILLKGGFLYSRQTWPEVFRLSETKATFYFSREDGSEKELISGLSLYGGSLLPCWIVK